MSDAASHGLTGLVSKAHGCLGLVAGGFGGLGCCPGIILELEWATSQDDTYRVPVPEIMTVMGSGKDAYQAGRQNMPRACALGAVILVGSPTRSRVAALFLES